MTSERPHILVVDDDREIRSLVSDYLQKSGYRVTAVGDGPAMHQVIEHKHVDLIVLDLMLPGEDGLTLCRNLRRRSQVPVIILSAMGEEIDRVVGLEVGADDYLSKPFGARELLGRIKAILRRASHTARDSNTLDVHAYEFAEWRLNTTERTLTHEDGTQIALRGSEFRLLSVLLAHAPNLLSRSQLTTLLHGRDLDPFDRSLDVRVSRLRQTLRDDGRSPRILKTVYGEGYVIGVKVEHVQ
jgi:two-component system OmpR family response regulator